MCACCLFDFIHPSFSLLILLFMFVWRLSILTSKPHSLSLSLSRYTCICIRTSLSSFSFLATKLSEGASNERQFQYFPLGLLASFFLSSCFCTFRKRERERGKNKTFCNRAKTENENRNMNMLIVFPLALLDLASSFIPSRNDTVSDGRWRPLTVFSCA